MYVDDDKDKEILKELQAPFDESLMKWSPVGGTGRAANKEKDYFDQVVYAQRLDDVLGSGWSSRNTADGVEITITLTGRQAISRFGTSFIEICEMFGVGRYVNHIPWRDKTP